ncbi:MAG: iron-siderophore ABC transporter substrate-binding protein [Leptolyngbya sp. SIO1E4]|nr:iron-siderophore ABC transporter substrate-binding protein [Leptolyngbya sp. SIO1E4]
MGKTEVPVNPQTVVVLSGLDTVLSLGTKPVGWVTFGVYDDYLENEVEGVESVGSYPDPNLEAIVSTKPDLILGTKSGEEKNYELLSQIAPTVIVDIDSSGDWKKLLNRYAEVLGRTDKAEQVMADYYARIEEFQAQMSDHLDSTEVSIVKVNSDDIEIYLEESFCGTVVADAGLPRPPHQENTEQTFSMAISKELLHKADGDAIFVWTGGRSEEAAGKTITAWQQLKDDPLWSKLNAVQQGKVYDVPKYWLGMGPIAANLVLDDLFKYLVDSPSQASQ